MSSTIILGMVRRTITLPADTDERIRAAAAEGESFSAAIVRLAQAGLLGERGDRPEWIGSGDSGDPDLAFNVEAVLDELARTEDPDD